MTKPDKPHYIYVRKEVDGTHTLVIMSRDQKVQEQPLTFTMAMQFAKSFTDAAIELHKEEVTRLGNKEKQEDLFTNGTADISEDNSRTSA